MQPYHPNLSFRTKNDPQKTGGIRLIFFRLFFYKKNVNARFIKFQNVIWSFEGNRLRTRKFYVPTPVCVLPIELPQILLLLLLLYWFWCLESKFKPLLFFLGRWSQEKEWNRPWYVLSKYVLNGARVPIGPHMKQSVWLRCSVWVEDRTR